MNAIVRLRDPMLLLTAAAGVFAIGVLVSLISFATLSTGSASGVNTFDNLSHASDWLQFVGALLALAAVCTAAWETMADRRKDEQIELGIAALATLLIAIGSLLGAVSTGSTATADVLQAIGFGIWALLALFRAGKLNLAEHQAHTSGTEPAQRVMLPVHQWLLAAAGIAIFAISSGLDVGPTDQGAGIAAGILEAVGFGLVAFAIVSSRGRHMLKGVPSQVVIIGLAVLVAAGVADAIFAGLVFTNQGTVTGLRIGGAISLAIRFLGILILGWAAWTQLREVASHHPTATAPSTAPAGGSS